MRENCGWSLIVSPFYLKNFGFIFVMIVIIIHLLYKSLEEGSIWLMYSWFFWTPSLSPLLSYFTARAFSNPFQRPGVAPKAAVCLQFLLCFCHLQCVLPQMFQKVECKFIFYICFWLLFAIPWIAFARMYNFYLCISHVRVTFVFEFCA